MKNLMLSGLGLALALTLGCAMAPNSLPRVPAQEYTHDGHSHKAGGGDAAPNCSAAGWNNKITAKQQAVIDKVIATRAHRLQHALWHAVRGGLRPQETEQVVGAFGKSWSENHPLCPAPGSDAQNRKYNPVGEDFLFMHHEMIEMLQQEFVAQKLTCIQGFKNISDIAKWPLPKGSREGAKSPAALKKYAIWDGYFQNPEWLRTVSLSQLGWSLEFTLHNNLHMRFTDDRPPKPFQAARPEEDGALVPYDGKFPAVWSFDNPKYNWLADPYGAAVNPTFWKIHGYVDHIIDLWLAANGFKTAAIDCAGKKDCYQWRGTWVGELRASHGSGNGDSDAPTRAGPPTSQEREDNLKFLQFRLRQQRIGVVTEEELQRPTRGGPSDGVGADPNDPVVVAESRLCGNTP